MNYIYNCSFAFEKDINSKKSANVPKTNNNFKTIEIGSNKQNKNIVIQESYNPGNKETYTHSRAISSKLTFSPTNKNNEAKNKKVEEKNAKIEEVRSLATKLRFLSEIDIKKLDQKYNII